jgi:hypothetical protein
MGPIACQRVEPDRPGYSSFSPLRRIEATGGTMRYGDGKDRPRRIWTLQKSRLLKNGTHTLRREALASLREFGAVAWLRRRRKNAGPEHSRQGSQGASAAGRSKNPLQMELRSCL